MAADSIDQNERLVSSYGKTIDRTVPMNLGESSSSRIISTTPGFQFVVPESCTRTNETSSYQEMRKLPGPEEKAVSVSSAVTSRVMLIFIVGKFGKKEELEKVLRAAGILDDKNQPTTEYMQGDRRIVLTDNFRYAYDQAEEVKNLLEWLNDLAPCSVQDADFMNKLTPTTQEVITNKILKGVKRKGRLGAIRHEINRRLLEVTLGKAKRETDNGSDPSTTQILDASSILFSQSKTDTTQGKIDTDEIIQAIVEQEESSPQKEMAEKARAHTHTKKFWYAALCAAVVILPLMYYYGGFRDYSGSQQHFIQTQALSLGSKDILTYSTIAPIVDKSKQIAIMAGKILLNPPLARLPLQLDDGANKIQVSATDEFHAPRTNCEAKLDPVTKEVEIDPKTGKPILKCSSYKHHGFDFRLPRGTAIFPTLPGRVYYVGSAGDYGQIIVIEHGVYYGGDDLFSVYAHLRKVLVKKGEFVEFDKTIAESGDSGNAEQTGPMLHFEAIRVLDSAKIVGVSGIINPTGANKGKVILINPRDFYPEWYWTLFIQETSGSKEKRSRDIAKSYV